MDVEGAGDGWTHSRREEVNDLFDYRQKIGSNDAQRLDDRVVEAEDVERPAALHDKDKDVRGPMADGGNARDSGRPDPAGGEHRPGG